MPDGGAEVVEVDVGTNRTDTVAGIVRAGAAACPQQLAIVGPTGVTRSYSDLYDRGTRLGHALLGLVPERGSRIAAWMEDSASYVELYVACALAGLVVVPINARYTEHEARHIVEDSDSDLLVFSGALEQRACAVLATLPSLRAVAVTPSPAAMFAFEDLVHSGATVDLAPVAPADLLIIGYTSGTTGRPKGAMLTQGSVAALARMNALSYRLPIGGVAALTGSMSFVAVVPSHIFSHFYMRGTVRVLGEWDVESLLATVEEHRATFTYIPSPLLGEFAIAAAEDPARWQSLQTVLHSASKAPVSKLRALADVIGYRLVEGWGMTENSGGLVTATTPADVLGAPGTPDRLATAGRAVPEVDLRVVDPYGAPLPHDGISVGELVVSSPALMAGYWRLPAASAAALKDGWYHTGDLGTIDAEGYVQISDRRVDLIVSGGMNVYPFEVEECILALPGVAACAVIGVPHERWGQTVTAAVVLEPGVQLDEATVIEHCKKFLASYKKPTAVRFLEQLPTTTSMKISRNALRGLLS